MISSTLGALRRNHRRRPVKQRGHSRFGFSHRRIPTPGADLTARAGSSTSQAGREPSHNGSACGRRDKLAAPKVSSSDQVIKSTFDDRLRLRIDKWPAGRWRAWPPSARHYVLDAAIDRKNDY